ncbi:mitochondrial carrier protein [Pseudohyphozyma bogoriensis]|nr:mitochondrial carrier protein [Pseudohyphozyma bogoriensis]
MSNRYESTADYLDTDAPVSGTMLRAFVTSSLLSFTSTALVMPFEVGKTLAQVQWVPRDGLEPVVYPGNEDVVEEETVELEDENEVDSYFSDLQSRGPTSFALPLDIPRRPVSPSGYLMRSGVSDEALGTKPEWIMPVVVQGGVWDMMKTLGRWKGEGWSSLWKAQFTTWLLDAATNTVQPILLSVLSAAFVPASSLIAVSTLPLLHSPNPTPLLICTTVSHAATTLLFSPWDLVRTRLIVQSAQLVHRKYSGPLNAMQTIVREEGGWWNTYFHPHVFFPALFEGVVRPLIHLSTPLIISRFLRIEPSSSPLTFAVAEFVLSCSGLLLTIPLETVRKRLQIQTRADYVRGGRPGGTGRAWRTCVETRPAPYVGMVDAVYRILTEETGKIPRRRRRSMASREDAVPEEKVDLGSLGLGASSGLRQLYRGLGMGVGANAVVFLLGIVAGGDEVGGWAEV